jgi:phenylalanyl-tRNA synthetase alpha chain
MNLQPLYALSMSVDWNDWLSQIASADATALNELELKLLGRKQGVLTDALKALGTLSPDERKAKGQELNVWKDRVTQAVADRRDALSAASLSTLGETDAIDITLVLPSRIRGTKGHLHLIPEFMRQVEEVFGRMGFDIAEGTEIETEEYNFTKLNIPADHPARDMQDTFFIDGKPGYVLRTHTSNGQLRYMDTHKPPLRMICPGRVYRKDSDATHSPMFHQFEGLMVDRDISLANMKAVMTAGFTELIGREVEFRFRTGYFPFVEPGLEVDMLAKNADGSDRWLEVVGCGMVHPTVLKNGGIDPTEFKGFAFGFGIERLLMIKHRISDLRSFYEGDLRFLAQF